MISANDTLVLLDTVLLADLHESGWRGLMEGSESYLLGVADPVRLDHCPSGLRQDLDAALHLSSVRRVLLPDVTALGELEDIRRYFSYEERVLLAIARTEGYMVASEGSVFRREARKLIPSGKLLTRADLIDLAGVIFERKSEVPLPLTAIADDTDPARLWQVWSDAGDAATKEARTHLHAKGIGVVAKRNGVVIEELPDGTIRPLRPEGRN